jgi:hypothetical protein
MFPGPKTGAPPDGFATIRASTGGGTVVVDDTQCAMTRVGSAVVPVTDRRMLAVIATGARRSLRLVSWTLVICGSVVEFLGAQQKAGAAMDAGVAALGK